MFREIASTLGEEYPASDVERDVYEDDDEEGEEETRGMSHECEDDINGAGGEECMEEEMMECDEVVDPEAPYAAPTTSPKPLAEPKDGGKMLTPEQQHELIRPSSTAGPSGLQSKRDILREKLEMIKTLQDQLGMGSYGCTS